MSVLPATELRDVAPASRQLAFIYHEVYDGRGFSRLSDSWRRYGLSRQLLRDVGLLPSLADPSLAAAGQDALGTFRRPDDGLASNPFFPLVECRPTEATDDEILRVHSPELLTNVLEGDARGIGFLDYGDTPAWPGVLRRAKLAVGGTLLAARLVAGGSFRRAFNPAGGLHHAHRDRIGGFCPFNDIVIAVRCLQNEFGYRRIAIVDLDGHHGDGTETLLYDEPILTVSLHRYNGRFYPRTGTASDVGRGDGFAYNLNVPLERGTDGKTYLEAFERWVIPAVRDYRPEILLVVVGADSHFADPLVRLGLDLPTFRQLAWSLSVLADDLCSGRLVAMAGGGYAPERVARCWTVYLSALSGAWGEDDPRLQELYRADAEFDVRQSS